MVCARDVRSLLGRVRWFNLAILAITPAVGVYGAYTTRLRFETLIWSVTYYVISMLGKYTHLPPRTRNDGADDLQVLPLVSAPLSAGVTKLKTYLRLGYHRLWSHRSYNASRPLQYLLCLMGASAVQGSVYWWARGHRSHHRYTDTPLDPYNANRGLFYTHIGWMLVKPTVKPGPADVSDLKKDAVVQWQHRWYFAIIPVVGYALPAVVAGLGWGDWWGGWYYAGMWRITFVHHVSERSFSALNTLGR